MRIYQCEDTLEGIFTAICLAWEEGQEPEDCRISLTEELFLFAEYRRVETNPEKAYRLMRAMRQRFGEEDYYSLCLALAAEETEKAQAVYGTLFQGVKERAAQGHLLDGQADAQVRRVFELARNVSREYDHYRGFLRFEELENGALVARIRPRNNLMTFLMPHFADRFPGEHFMICDMARGLIGLHPAGGEWSLFRDGEFSGRIDELKHSDREPEYEMLFRHFCDKITIRERENRELQKNLLPLRFREYMVEFW